MELKRVTIRMQKSKHLTLKIQAAKEESTLEQIILDAVEMYMQSNCKDS